MQPRMSDSELRLFESFLNCSDRYLEFGSGGSTYFAAHRVKSAIVTIDSSKEWLDTVAQKCAADQTPVQPKLTYVDIGATGDWGTPTDKTARDRWPHYHQEISKSGFDADLYLVDGGFRVAGFMQIILHSRADTLIAFHDFRSRDHYHVVRAVAREISVAADLSVFQPLPINDKIETAQNILKANEFNPA